MNTDVVEYECGADVIQNMDADRMFSQFGTDTNNKIIDSYLIVCQVYNDIIHNILKFNHKKYDLSTLLVLCVR
jgi:hypothetical protein